MSISARWSDRFRGAGWRSTLAFLLLAVACNGDDSETFPPGPSSQQLVAVVSNLEIPADWNLVSETVAEEPCVDLMVRCPAVERDYEVATDSAFREQLVDMFQGSDLQILSLPTECATPVDLCSAYTYTGNVALVVRVVDVQAETATVRLIVTERQEP
jgi:hypothetical protein